MNKFKKWIPLGISLLSLLFWGILWQIAASIMGKPLLLPSPLSVCKTLFLLMKTGTFWQTVALSLFRILLGILAALLMGALLAFLTVKSKAVNWIFSPLLSVIKSTPVASVIFLMLLFIGRDGVPTVIAFIMALPIVWSNLREGLLAADRELLEMAKVFGVSQEKQYKEIRLPAVKPFFLAACRSALSLSWKAGIAAEVLCVPEKSLGRAIFESKQYLLTDELFAYTLTVILISVCIEKAALYLLHTKKKERRETNAEN